MFSFPCLKLYRTNYLTMLRIKYNKPNIPKLIPKLQKCFYSQTSRITFTNLEDHHGDIPNQKTYMPINLKDLSIPSKKKEKNINQLNNLPTMGQIDLDSFNINKDQEASFFDVSLLPTWYERLNQPSTYRIHKDLESTSFPFRSFRKCYSRILTLYFDTYITLPPSQMYELQKKLYYDREDKSHIPDSVQKLEIKIDRVTRKLSELSLNTYIIFKRLGIRRSIPPFYLHQQFSVNLNERNLSNLLNLYFELPKPRPLYLRRDELEQFLSLILSTKVSNDDNKALLPKIIDVFEDMYQNVKSESMEDFQLTPFENTKYLSLLLNYWKSKNMSQEEKFNNIINLRMNSLKFCPAMWDILLSHLPEYCNEIMKIMSEKSGLTRLSAGVFIRYLTTYDELNNTLELMKLKNYHLDSELLDTIITKYIEFGKIKEAKELMIEFFKFSFDLSSTNWEFPTLRKSRTELFKIDVLNKTLQQLKNENFDDPITFSWLRYKFKPNPITMGNLLTHLDSLTDEKDLLNIMVEQKIPISNKHALKLLTFQTENLADRIKFFENVPLVLKLVNESYEFNDNLHVASTDSKYDTETYKKYVHIPTGTSFELKEIVKTSIEIYEEISTNSTFYNIRANLANQLVRLNDKLKYL